MILCYSLANYICYFSWWKGLDIATNFPFIRDRFVEGYSWILGVYFESHYSIARTFMTKLFAMTSMLDDIYDAYGTHEELEIFTKAIHRLIIQTSTLICFKFGSKI